MSERSTIVIHVLISIHNFARNRYTLLISGILVSLLAVYDFTSLSLKGQARTSFFDSLGLIGLGVTVLTRGLAEIFESINEIEEAAERGSMDRLNRSMIRIFNSVAASPLFEFSTALLVLLAGCFEALRLLKSQSNGANQMWHFGIILLGVTLVARSTSALIKASSFAESAAVRLNVCFSVIHRVNHFLRQPSIEVAVGLILVLVVLWQVIRGSNAGEASGARAYYGLLLVGILRIAQFLPSLLKSLRLITDFEEPLASTTS